MTLLFSGQLIMRERETERETEGERKREKERKYAQNRSDRKSL